MRQWVTLGQPLPRAEDAYFVEPKIVEWLLGARHGPEWAKVFRVDQSDAGYVWNSVRAAILAAPVTAVRDHGRYGLECEVVVELELNQRRAHVLTAWEVRRPGAAPRLVTAFPRT